MSWFKRLKDGITTASQTKKDVPEGIWYHCKKCKETSTHKELRENFYKCPKCDFHARIGSKEYFELLYDDGKYVQYFEELRSVDPLEFHDLKPYSKRLVDTFEKTQLTDAVAVADGKVNGLPLVTACMDFKFIGGSMGSVVGERISLAIDLCIETNTPFLMISKSGGARMMEAAFSLFQMAKTSAKLTLLAKAGIPFLSLMTHPTTGGVTASYAMLGDINMGEPEALIGFAGPRVIKETIKKDLPEGFQSAEFLMEHGFLDLIVNRKDMKETIHELIGILQQRAV